MKVKYKYVITGVYLMKNYNPPALVNLSGESVSKKTDKTSDATLALCDC
jgi:hypothetical protein